MFFLQRAVRISTLSMIDLAGSESLKLSGAKGTRKAEGGYINKSLLTLGKIIYKLSEAKNNPNMHVPYRDSKLTRVCVFAFFFTAAVACG